MGDYVRNYAPALRYVVPELHHRPARAMEQVLAVCEGVAPADLTFVGSSLGGFYATVAAERLGCRAALLNPAVHPHAHFGRYLGPQKNLYTGEEFVLTPGHVEELRAMDPPAITRPDGCALAHYLNRPIRLRALTPVRVTAPLAWAARTSNTVLSLAQSR